MEINWRHGFGAALLSFSHKLGFSIYGCSPASRRTGHVPDIERSKGTRCQTTIPQPKVTHGMKHFIRTIGLNSDGPIEVRSATQQPHCLLIFLILRNRRPPPGYSQAESEAWKQPYFIFATLEDGFDMTSRNDHSLTCSMCLAPGLPKRRRT